MHHNSLLPLFPLWLSKSISWWLVVCLCYQSCPPLMKWKNQNFAWFHAELHGTPRISETFHVEKVDCSTRTNGAFISSTWWVFMDFCMWRGASGLCTRSTENEFAPVTGNMHTMTITSLSHDYAKAIAITWVFQRAHICPAVIAG